MLEMRKFVRFDTQQSASLIRSDGLELIVKLDNISIGGARFMCDHFTAQSIVPNSYQPDPATPILLTIKIDLGDLNTGFEAICGIKSYYRLAQNIYRFHVNFSTIDQENKLQLNSLITKKLMTNTLAT